MFKRILTLISIFSLIVLFSCAREPKPEVKILEKPLSFTREKLFGIDKLPYRWSGRAGIVDNAGSSSADRISSAVDAEVFYIQRPRGETEVFLITDGFNIHWVSVDNISGNRVFRNYNKLIQHLNTDAREYIISSLEIAVGDRYFDPKSDFIYATDAPRHRLLKFRFEFDSDYAPDDELILADSIYVDSLFHPEDIEYINFNSGNRDDNFLISTDVDGERLIIFSHEGTIKKILDIQNYNKLGFIGAIECKVEKDNSVIIYAINTSSLEIMKFRLDPGLRLKFLKKMQIGEKYTDHLIGISYSKDFGLWALKDNRPLVSIVDEGLSGRITDITSRIKYDENIKLIYNLVFFEDRLIIFDEDTEYSLGISSLKYHQY